MRDLNWNLIDMDLARTQGQDLEIVDTGIPLGRAAWSICRTMQGTYEWSQDYGVNWTTLLPGKADETMIAAAVQTAVQALGPVRIRQVTRDGRSARIVLEIARQLVEVNV